MQSKHVSFTLVYNECCTFVHQPFQSVSSDVAYLATASAALLRGSVHTSPDTRDSEETHMHRVLVLHLSWLRSNYAVQTCHLSQEFSSLLSSLARNGGTLLTFTCISVLSLQETGQLLPAIEEAVSSMQ